MTWVKLTDGALRDPRLTLLPRGSRLLFLELLAWRNEHLLELEDDLIPYHALRWLTDEPDAEDATVPIVVAGGMLDEGAGWRLVWFVGEQKTAEEVAAQRAEWKVRQERHRRHVAGDHSKCERCWYVKKSRVTSASRVTNGTPTRPDPSRPEGERDGQDRGGQAQAPPLPAEEEQIRRLRDLLADPSTTDLGRQNAEHQLQKLGAVIERLTGAKEAE
jgi:hypothetical protein